ncbi:methyltransferase domain-containing protein [Rhizobium leguminosarum]|uniref:methyltransferase domain-containing protein n=1 Tax=Rhizobium leguminosarum TaxID=384 RepID=UPI001030790D|nr:methyltransferase domain-containing protein [Rhizobium leguminosarum]TBG24190.1 methyltransferase domain-containing protein [Rhizobium leguminosarum]TBG40711.1 methyltransferase domain-containing protein [Rhizobium leguminosarum]
MGINAELVELTAKLRQSKFLAGNSVIELGAQDVCVVEPVIKTILSNFGFPTIESRIERADSLYRCLGFTEYRSIDASGEKNALLFDLNNDLRETYEFHDSFDLVTNLGTAEHCFDQRSVFKNIHTLCKVGGIMIHALPAQGNVNHAFYNYHPRFFIDTAVANKYEVISLNFTVDYNSELISYTPENFKKWDSHDVLFYAVFRRTEATEFRLPFDGMFAAQNQLLGYGDTDVNPLVTDFAPYLKSGNWENTKGLHKTTAPTRFDVLRSLAKRIFSYAK